MGTGMDMRSTTKTRAQRRVEKKQALMLVALVLVISVVSFVLGVVVGRHSEGPAVAQQVSEPQRIVVDDKLVVPAEAVMIDAEPVAEKLTFYDNLSKDETAPIGSGINLPPVVEQPMIVDEVKVSVASIKPEVPQSTAISAPVPAPTPAPVPAPVPLPVQQSTTDPDRLPAVTNGAAWVVQVFSSRSAADAGMLRDKLGGKGYPAFITEADLGKKGIWYRVLFGPYADKAAAVQAQTYAERKDKLAGFAKRR